MSPDTKYPEGDSRSGLQGVSRTPGGAQDQHRAQSRSRWLVEQRHYFLLCLQIVLLTGSATELTGSPVLGLVLGIVFVNKKGALFYG